MKNKNSVWTLSSSKRYYLTHPWMLFYDIYWNFRNFIHRGRYGFAYVDAWNWNNWWMSVGAEALRYMADKGSAYPGVEPYDTPEKWNKHLHELADQLDWCSESMEWDDSQNEYNQQMKEIIKRCNRTEERDGLTTTWLEMTDEDQKIRDKYFEREKEIEKENENKRIEILSKVGKDLGFYWD